MAFDRFLHDVDAEAVRLGRQPVFFRGGSLKHPFVYQAPTPEQVVKIQEIRRLCDALYDALVAELPSSAERTLAVRKLEECSMWANKAIVFDGERYLP